MKISAIRFAAFAFLAELALASPDSASRSSPIHFENDLVLGAIGKEMTSDVLPSLPMGARQQRGSSGCLLRRPPSQPCDIGIKEVFIENVGASPMRIRAVFLQRNTGKHISVSKPYGQSGLTENPVWQIVDGFAFRDEQIPGKRINMRKPFLEIDACELFGQPNANIVAIGKVISRLREITTSLNSTLFITRGE